jgi:methylenetetrahydrofolate reductase (NADPH)
MNTLKISFEFFPPKTDEGVRLLDQTMASLKEASPEFCSVTFGAGGSTREGTLQTVQRLQKTGIPIAPHLASVGLSKNEIKSILKTYQSLNIDRIVALRGDLPSGMGQDSELKYAHELVALIRETTGNTFHIEVAAYPEIHPQAKNAKGDIKNLKKKMEAGADSAITQYFFNADAYFYLLDECAKENIHFPIVPGIMPITNFAKLVRFSDMCGAEIPRWIRERLQSYGDDIESIQAFGLEVIHTLCKHLLEGGAPGLHFYTLNQADASLKVLKLL